MPEKYDFIVREKVLVISINDVTKQVFIAQRRMEAIHEASENKKRAYETIEMDCRPSTRHHTEAANIR